ncbi:unnamed protein product, partial [marine sediment metagenome]
MEGLNKNKIMEIDSIFLFNFIWPTNINILYKKKIVVVVEKPFFVEKAKNWVKRIT